VGLKLKVINFSTSPPRTPPSCFKNPFIFIRANLGDIKTIGKNYKIKGEKLHCAYFYSIPPSDKNKNVSVRRNHIASSGNTFWFSFFKIITN
jgi:hypothetical protein